MDLVALALAKKYADSRIANFGGADWAQNVSGANDYVKNRTHYEEKAILFDGTIPEDAIPFPAIEGGCFVKIQDMPLSYDELLNKEIVLTMETNEGNMESPGTLTEDSLMQEEGLVMGAYNGGTPVVLSALTDFNLPLDENIVLSFTKGLYFFVAETEAQKVFLSRLGKDGVKQLDAKFIPELPQYAKKEEVEEVKLIQEMELDTENRNFTINMNNLKYALIYITWGAAVSNESAFAQIYKGGNYIGGVNITISSNTTSYTKIELNNNNGLAYYSCINQPSMYSSNKTESAQYIEGITPFTRVSFTRNNDANFPIGTKISVWGVEA